MSMKRTEGRIDVNKKFIRILGISLLKSVLSIQYVKLIYLVHLYPINYGPYIPSTSTATVAIDATAISAFFLHVCMYV
jgi:hypothetical protein